MKLGIIGTAGRNSDGDKLKNMWRSMRNVAICSCIYLKPRVLISGGAAYSDHLCVQLFLEGFVKELTLHLPVEWKGLGFKENGDKFDAGRTSNYYHNLFSNANGFNSLEEIERAIKKGAKVEIGKGFKDRNTAIANESHHLLSFTFGEGEKLKDGGTLDTMQKFLKRREFLENSKTIHNLRAFHFCLNKKRLYEI